MSKIILIGANHAGTAAIRTILSNYSGHEVVVFDRNSNISFLGCGIALWVGNQIDGPDGLFYASKEELEAMGARIHMETEVQNIDFQKKLVYVVDKSGKAYEESYDKLILSTGSIPVNPHIPGQDLENVQFIKLYQHAEELVHKLKNPNIQNIAVVGAGYIGVELAEAFERQGKKVILIDSCSDCLSAYYDDIFRARMHENLEKHHIKIHFNESVQEIKGSGKVQQIVTNKGTYDTDMVVFAIGFIPNSQIGKDTLKLFKNGAYVVDRTQQTSMKDVYAIGDCATVFDNAIQDISYIALATNAVRSGIIAGHNVAGTHLESPGVQGSNGISIYGFHMVSTGITLEKAKKLGIKALATDFTDMQKPEFIKENNYPVTLRIVYDQNTRRILGAQMASYYDMSMGLHMFSLAIQQKLTIDELKLLDIFFLPHFNKPYNYITMSAISAK